MKKKLSIVLLVLVVAIASAFALTACGETNGNGNGDNSGSTVVTPDTDTGNGGDGSGNQGDGNSNETHTHAFTLELTADKYLASPSTCTARAKYYYSCNCGEKGTETFESGNMLPHTYDKQVATDKYLASPATATSAARYYYSCVCGAKGTATFEYGEAIIPETEGLQYTLLDDDTYEVTFDGNAVTGDALTKIVIPSKYNGKAVTKIAYLAFYDYDSLVEIEIPETITKIGDYAFLYSGGLMQITVDPNNKNYQSINGNLYSKDGRTLIQYAAGKTDTSFTIPENVTQIDKFAFNECRNLTSVTLPQNLESVGVGAFDLIGILTGNTGIGDTNEYNGAYYLGSVTIRTCYF